MACEPKDSCLPCKGAAHDSLSLRQIAVWSEIKPYQGLDKVLQGSSAAEVRPIEVAVFKRPQQLPLHCLQVLYQPPHGLLLVLKEPKASCTMAPLCRAMCVVGADIEETGTLSMIANALALKQARTHLARWTMLLSKMLCREGIHKIEQCLRHTQLA